MKIWYQSLTREGTWPQYQSALRKMLDESKDPGTQIEVHGITKVGGVADQFRYMDYLETAEVLENCQQAVREGFDAFVIGNIGDPGLQICREIVNIPVLGLCETSAHLACMMGASFSLVANNEKFIARLVENIERYGLRQRLRSVSRMRVERMNDFDACFTHQDARQRVIDQFLEAAAKNVDAGAEVVIVAGGVPMILLALAGIHEAAPGVPLLNGVIGVLKSAEAVVRLNRMMGGRFHSKRLSYAPPNGDQIDEIRKYYGDSVFPGIVSTRSQRS